MSATKTMATRKCSHCGKPMSEGYVIDGGDEYYCSERCLHRHHSPKEYEKKYADGEGNSYWTTFDD